MSVIEMADRDRPMRALEARFYTDPAIYEAEREAIFYRTWIYAGHVSELRRQGDYFTFRILDQNLFCVRDRDGEVRCFYNVCQHRAHELVEGAGNKRLLVCPYHAWSYELDGRLKTAPNAKAVPGFEKAEICLTQVRVEDFCGFLFVNLDPEAAPMAEWFPGVEAELRAFVPQIDRLATMRWYEIDEACNWKVTVENYSECYHCRLNHPTFASGVIDPACYNIRPQGYCLRHTTGSAHLERLSYAIDPEANEHAGEYSSWFLWPSFSFQVYPGNVLNTYLWRPDSVGRTLVYRGWYSEGGVESEMLERLAEQDLNTTVAEDVRLVNSVQRGLASRGYRPGPLILDPAGGLNSEHSLQAMHGWVREALGER